MKWLQRLFFFADDALVILGLFVILIPTYKINVIAGLYATGVIMCLAGVLLAKARAPTKRS